MRLLLGVAIGASTAPDLRFGSLQTILEIFGTLGGIGAIITAGVLIYKARSEKGLNSVKAMEVLFEKQREFNRQEIEKRDSEISELRRKLARSNGDREILEAQLHRCELDRTLLQNQIRGLDETIEELHRQRGHADKPKRPPHEK